MILSRIVIAIAVLVVVAIALAAVSDPPATTAPKTPADPPMAEDWKARSIFTLETRTLEGEPVKLSKYDGKVVLVVNLASECGYTPQYEGLEKLYKEFKDQGLVILGFPCNDFGGQEPGSPREIREFCTNTYHVTFPLFEKVTVQPGDKQCLIYKALQARTDMLPKWNFCKYLVSRDGTKARFFDSKITPESKELRDAIAKALSASK